MLNLIVGVRAWAVALLLANLIFAGWHIGYPDKRAAVGLPDLQPTLKLVDERTDIAGSETSCLRWGPFESEAAVLEVQTTLADLLQRAEIVQRTIASDPDYLVYVGPLSSIEMARHTQQTLRSQNIDSQVIVAGPLLNSLSVGVFTSRLLADAHLQLVKDLGYPVSVEVLNRHHQVFHLQAFLRLADNPQPPPNGFCEPVARTQEFL